MNNQNFIFGVDELESSYSQTRIFCPIELAQTDGDYGHDTKTLFDVDVIDNEDLHNNVYIGKQLCTTVLLKKVEPLDFENDRNSKWETVIYIHGILSWDDCYSLVEKYLCFISYSLSKKNINNHNGVPKFFFDFMRMKIEYAKDDGLFDKNHFCVQGKVSSKTSVLFSDNPIILKSEAFSTDSIEWFYDAISRPDIRSKYLLLYSFVEPYIPKNTKDDKKGEGIYHNLLSRGIRSYTLHNEQIDIQLADIEKLVVRRNDIAHNRKPDDLHGVLYNILLPLALRIMDV